MQESIVRPLRRWDPERIGPYSIIGKLGAGAMGQVFLARSVAGRLVAVKTIRIELAEEPGYRARFAREVAAASRVSGVFTAAVIQADAEADLPWVATAYVPAPSLSTLVRRCGPLPVPAVRWLAAGCAEALQSIHGVGLLHRDVKPSNVLVAPDGPQVIDFGVARAAERVQLTTTRGAAGTPAYMAPEQARDATLVSSASDIFSLGATLVFAATGHAPYQGETVMDILVRLATEPPDLTGLPGELTGLVSACLERVPRDRPTEAAILAELGSFAFPSGPGHSYLPDSAMAVIAEYLHNPGGVTAGGVTGGGATTGSVTTGDAVTGRAVTGRAVTGRAVTGRGDGHEGLGDFTGSAGGETNGSGAAFSTDGTSASHTALPGFQSPAAFQPGPLPPSRRGRGRRGFRPPAGPWPAPGTEARPGAHPGARAGRWAGWAIAAVALIGAGIGAGLLLHGSGSQAAGTLAPVAVAPCTAPPGAPGAPGTSGAPGAFAGGGVVPLSSTPMLCVSQPYGDGDTVFIIHGSGFVPFAAVTVRLVGVGVPPDHPLASPDRPVADQEGTFNYAIDQGHFFFAGPIPPGKYRAMVTASGGRRASALFQVYRSEPTAPPSGS